MNELLGLPYMVGKTEMFSFQPNLNHKKNSLVSPDISQTVHEGLE